MTLFKIPLAALALSAVAALAVPASIQSLAQDAAKAEADAAVDPAKVVATIGGQDFTEADLALVAADLQAQMGNLPPEQRRAAALSALIEIKVLAQKAEAENLDETDEFRRRMDFLRDRALHNAYFKKAVVDELSDEAVRARYDEQIAALPTEEEIKARHILLKTREEAEAVIAELEGGADFEALAKEKSTGPSAPQGGDLGFFSKGQMVPPFEEAAFALEPGSYTKTPVETQFGFHVIKVEEKREKAPPAFEQVEDQLRQLLLRERYAEVLQSARDSVEVEIADPALAKTIEDAGKAGEPAPDNN